MDNLEKSIKETAKIRNINIKDLIREGCETGSIRLLNKHNNPKKKVDKKIKNLESRSKHLYNFIFPVEFKVNEVNGKTYPTSMTPYSEIMIGGRSPVYETGFTSRLVLNVKPYDKNISVTELIFEGYCPVLAGNDISALIPKFKEKQIPSYSWDSEKISYLDRNFKKKEIAIRVSILSPEGKILGTYDAANYKSFAKK